MKRPSRRRLLLVWQAAATRRRKALRVSSLRHVRIVELKRLGRLRLQRAELPGRPETLLIVRGFASHVPHLNALEWVKGTYWGYDQEADDMQFLTQWKHIDLSSFGQLLKAKKTADHLQHEVSRGGFGQMRWYAVDRETSRHSDGFDGVCFGSGEPVVGCNRSLIRLGGDGFLTFHWEKRGGATGRLDLLLSHGDMVLMDRGIAGTRPSGWQRQKALRVTHRAGGLLAKHCPSSVSAASAALSSATRSFVTLVWTISEPREDFLDKIWADSAQHLDLPAAPKDGVSCWPLRPEEMHSLLWCGMLLPWQPHLLLADRQMGPDLQRASHIFPSTAKSKQQKMKKRNRSREREAEKGTKEQKNCSSSCPPASLTSSL
eukprot:TRINITY_DN22696_c0_g1_i1.p1 TRINITY_DN22696_c0_g1~~TRINITY_DN22696_c0_g1_i1.p1  ORF type:complete len:374 (+),score=62.48 TRINITY_DN22696_c0_g1_i1:46-1167(+)